MNTNLTFHHRSYLRDHLLHTGDEASAANPPITRSKHPQDYYTLLVTQHRQATEITAKHELE